MQINNNGTRQLFYSVQDDNQFGGPTVINSADLPAGQVRSIFGLNQDGSGTYNFRWQAFTRAGEEVGADSVSTSDAGYTAYVS